MGNDLTALSVESDEPKGKTWEGARSDFIRGFALSPKVVGTALLRIPTTIRQIWKGETAYHKRANSEPEHINGDEYSGLLLGNMVAGTMVILEVAIPIVLSSRGNYKPAIALGALNAASLGYEILIKPFIRNKGNNPLELSVR